MRKIALSTATLLCAASSLVSSVSWAVETPSTAPSSTPSQVQTQTQSVDLATAYSELNNISIDSPSYLDTFLEIQKVHYKSENWDRFFGFASFYRKNLAAKKFVADLFLLETLALIKHCQIRPSIQVLQAAYSQAQDVMGQGTPALAHFEEQIGTIQNYLILQNNFPGVIKTDPTNHSPSIFTKSLLWKVSEHKASAVVQGAVKSPANVRVYVENVCKKRD